LLLTAVSAGHHSLLQHLLLHLVMKSVLLQVVGALRSKLVLAACPAMHQRQPQDKPLAGSWQAFLRWHLILSTMLRDFRSLLLLLLLLQ